ncbi:MAG: hypothetical protein K2Q34_08295, partial [Alphaproteobacteria bacterium]|nr:hypothetical protein [Alphaproteobacteria bacterium]
MNFIKCVLVVMLFAVTGTNVMAADYDVFGKKNVKFATFAPLVGLVSTGGDNYELTLSSDMPAKLRGIEPSQFSELEKVGGRAARAKTVANTMTLVQLIYKNIEEAAAKASGLDGSVALAQWFSRNAGKAGLFPLRRGAHEPSGPWRRGR